MSKLINYYDKVLELAGMHVDTNSYIKADNDEQVVIKGKALVMPTREHLATLTERDSNGKLESVKVVFNPLKENAIKAESDMLTKLRTAISARLNYSIYIVSLAMIKVAGDEKLQKRAKSRVRKFLASLHNVVTDGKTDVADYKTIKTFQKLFSIGSESNFYKNLVGLYIKKGGIVGKERFKRITVVDFPLYNEIVNNEGRMVRGVKLRIKDIDFFKALFEFIYPDIDDPLSLQIGSNNDVSPGLESLLSACFPIMENINLIGKDFKVNDDMVYYDTDFIDDYSIDDLKSELFAIPVEDTSNVNNRSNIRESINAPVNTPTAPVHTSNGLDPRSLVPNVNPLLANNQYPLPGQQVGYNQPAGFPNQPMGYGNAMPTNQLYGFVYPQPNVFIPPNNQQYNQQPPWDTTGPGAYNPQYVGNNNGNRYNSNANMYSNTSGVNLSAIKKV